MSMAKHFKHWTSTKEQFLFPPTLDEFVPQGHRAHLVRILVGEELDLRGIVNDYLQERGAPAFDPRMLTAVLIYAYMQGQYSSRKISQACEERLDFKVVSGMSSPDFRTIAKFRARHLEALGGVFKQALKLCQEAGLVKLKHVAIDGTKLKANASMTKSKSYKKLKEEEQRLGQEIADYFAKADEIDAEEDSEFGQDKRGDELPEWVTNAEERRKRFKKAKEALEKEHSEAQEKRKEQEQKGEKPPYGMKSGKFPKDTKRYNFTDPESKIQTSPGGGKIQGYNAQCAVDGAKNIIIATNVTNAQHDYDQLEPMLELIKESFEILPDEVSLDTGYCTEQNLKLLEKEKVRGYVALGHDPFVRKRTIPKGSALARMATRLWKGGTRTKYRLRKTIVEPVFGIIKGARGFRQFSMRGQKKVAKEFEFICAVYNLGRLLNIRVATS
jgi:transposase